MGSGVSDAAARVESSHESRSELPAPDLPTLFAAKAVDDPRGRFAKPLDDARRLELGFGVVELFWTSSLVGCIRGLHFQTPPYEVGKLVWVSAGAVYDVAVDLRPGPAFGTVHEFELTVATGATLFIPHGFAHGFQALEDGAIVNYAVDREYHPDHDEGVRWDSAGIRWPLAPTELSTRDRGFGALVEFDSPFEAAP